ncbi:MAG TPA: NAD(P)-dependent oxidoreductase, partial [Sphingomonas sp.]|nr:NAD(P)-dependent oxidoreductase [Sphingomonas sp.]
MRLLIFGPGYTATRLIARLEGRADITTVTRETFAGRARDIASATHILSTVPPGEEDPVLAAYAAELAASGAWVGYLSSTGVYGDAEGAWVDESAPTGTGRRTARARADAAWLG